MLYNGSKYGLRGRNEHAYLRPSQIQVGVYEAGHPLAGRKFVTITDMPDKTSQLTVNNTVLRKSFNRIPVYDQEEINDVGGMSSLFVCSYGVLYTDSISQAATFDIWKRLLLGRTDCFARLLASNR